MNRQWRRWAARKGVQLPSAVEERVRDHRGYWRDIIRHRWAENFNVTVWVDADKHPIDATIKAAR